MRFRLVNPFGVCIEPGCTRQVTHVYRGSQSKWSYGFCEIHPQKTRPLVHNTVWTDIPIDEFIIEEVHES